MVHRGRKITLKERLEISERWEAGQTAPEIATVMAISVWTVRKWRRKYQCEGRSGLVSRMGWPKARWDNFPWNFGTRSARGVKVILAGVQ